ncbi:GFA family protein [Pseudogemmobacter faecipullorum]|nr:GFA family protein [Pseudogemmobacter faecipullorum]
MRGSCLCGHVVFEADPPLRDVVACHCSQCRKVSGHYWAASAVVMGRFRLIEERGLKWFRSSEFARRGFCGDCGAALFWQPLPGADPSWSPEGPAMHFAPGALEGEAGLKLQAHIFKSDAGDYYRPEGPPPEPVLPGAGRVQGSCLCGANRFSVPAPLGEIWACHCGQCRKTSGHYAASFAVAESAVQWQAQKDRSHLACGGGRRGFCEDCGSSLWFRAADGSFSMEAGAFDAPTGGQLVAHIFMADAAAYDRPDDGLPAWPGWEEDAG